MESAYIWEQFKKIEEKNPVIHCLTNTVTIHDSANVLLAVGAAPTMAHNWQEMHELCNLTDGLLCNLGGLEYFESMLLAATAASMAGKPIVVDPVGCSSSSYRRQRFGQLLKTGKPSVIRGNVAEIMALAQNENSDAAATTIDYEDEEQLAHLVEITKNLSKEKDCIVIAAGTVDVITDGVQVALVRNGDLMMRKITGAGCLMGAVLTAFLAVNNCFANAVAASVFVGICGEMAAAKTREAGRGTMYFHDAFIDQMSLITEEDIEQYMKLE